MNLAAFETLTVKDAEQIAANHETDETWDFFEYLASIDNSQPVNFTEQEADHA